MGLTSVLAWTAEKLNIHPQGNIDVYSNSIPGMNQNIKSAKWRSCARLLFFFSMREMASEYELADSVCR